jgi:hypothetical protein
MEILGFSGSSRIEWRAWQASARIGGGEMSGWQQRGDLMFFSSLDNCNFGVFTVAYRFKDDSREGWTDRLNTFKFGYAAAGDQAVRGAYAVLSTALAKMTFPGPVALVSAISSKDTTLDPNSRLARLGAALAGALRWTWAPQALSKRAHRSLHGLKAGADRDAEVANAYQALNFNQFGTVLVLDDFATRGSTLADIGRAIRVHAPKVTIYGVALGKTEKAAYWASMNRPIDNSHVPQHLAALWDNA